MQLDTAAQYIIRHVPLKHFAYAAGICIYPAVLVEDSFFCSMFFAVEKTLSAGAVEAGIAKYFLASLAT